MAREMMSWKFAVCGVLLALVLPGFSGTAGAQVSAEDTTTAPTVEPPTAPEPSNDAVPVDASNVSSQQASPIEPTMESPSPAPVANLVASLMQPLTATDGGPVTITGTVSNTQETSGESRAALYATDTEPPLLLHAFVVPAMTLDASLPFSFDWSPPLGLSHVRLVVDADNSVFESDEGDNVADSWIYVDAPGSESSMTVPMPQDATVPSDLSWGSPDSIILQDRPMRIQVASDTRGLHIELDDGDPTGQVVWINAAQLAQAGITHPTFTYDGGSTIPFQKQGDYYRLDAPHFSMIHATDADAALFTLANGASQATVAWNTVLDRVDFTSAASDAVDESLLLDVVPHLEYSLEVEFGIDEQGNNQELYPLALGSSVERLQAAYDASYPEDSYGFLYQSNTLGQQRPSIEAYYSNTRLGQVVKLWEWTTLESPDGHVNPYEAWKVKLVLRRTGDQVWFYLWDLSGHLDRSVSVPVPDLPTANVAFFANHGMGAQAGVSSRGWSASLTLDPLSGDLLNGFGLPKWTREGTAANDSPGLYVTHQNAAPPSWGRAWVTGCPAADTLSIQFQYRLEPGEVTGSPDGFVFFFKKNTAYAPATGSKFGFEDASAGSTAGHEGYGIVFDARAEAGDPADGFIALVKDTITHRLATVDEARVGDGLTHTVNIEAFANLWVRVYFDGFLVINQQVPSYGAYPCFGFATATGAQRQNVEISNVLASTLPPNVPPTVPDAPNPPTSTVNVPTTSQLRWAASDPQGTVAKYTVLVDTRNPPVWVFARKCTVEASNGQPLACSPGAFAKDTTYYWQVTAEDGIYKVTSAVWSFHTVNNLAPNAPSTPQPASGAVGQGVSPTLAWVGGDPDGDSLTYIVRVDTVNPPATVACTRSTPSCTPQNLNYDTLYYWQVEAKDSFGGRTMGPVWSFRTMLSNQNHAPLAPSNPVPPSGGTAPSGFVAQWTGVDQDGDALTYNVWVAPGADPATQVNPVCSKVTTSSCTLGGLAPKTPYRWRVEASDGKLRTMGPVWSFTTRDNNAAPLAPSSPFPTHESTGQSVTPTLRWTSSDADGDLARYDVYVNGLKSCSTYAFECTLSLRQPDQVYSWFVVAFDGVHTVQGPTWSFRTRTNALPDVPRLPSPADLAREVSTSPTLSWTSPDPDGTVPTYEVYLDTDSYPWLVNEGQSCETVGTPSCTFTGLAVNQQYWWGVRASDEFGTVEGPVWSFFATSINRAPSLWTSAAPPHGAASEPTDVWLVATANDDDGDPLRYSFTFNDAPVAGCQDVPDPNCRIRNLAPGSTYWWSVAVTDGQAVDQESYYFRTADDSWYAPGSQVPECFGILPDLDGDWLPWWNEDPFWWMYYDPNADGRDPGTWTGGEGPYEAYTCAWKLAGQEWDPYVPLRPSPAGATDVDPAGPTLRWMGENPTGRHYTVRLDTISPPQRVACQDLEVSVCQAPRLHDDTTYYWRVVTGNGPSPMLGPIWSFRTGEEAGNACNYQGLAASTISDLVACAEDAAGVPLMIRYETSLKTAEEEEIIVETIDQRIGVPVMLDGGGTTTKDTIIDFVPLGGADLASGMFSFGVRIARLGSVDPIPGHLHSMVNITILGTNLSFSVTSRHGHPNLTEGEFSVHLSTMNPAYAEIVDQALMRDAPTWTHVTGTLRHQVASRTTDALTVHVNVNGTLVELTTSDAELPPEAVGTMDEYSVTVDLQGDPSKVGAVVADWKASHDQVAQLKVGSNLTVDVEPLPAQTHVEFAQNVTGTKRLVKLSVESSADHNMRLAIDNESLLPITVEDLPASYHIDLTIEDSADFYVLDLSYWAPGATKAPTIRAPFIVDHEPHEVFAQGIPNDLHAVFRYDIASTNADRGVEDVDQYLASDPEDAELPTQIVASNPEGIPKFHLDAVLGQGATQPLGFLSWTQNGTERVRAANLRHAWAEGDPTLDRVKYDLVGGPAASLWLHFDVWEIEVPELANLAVKGETWLPPEGINSTTGLKGTITGTNLAGLPAPIPALTLRRDNQTRCESIRLSNVERANWVVSHEGKKGSVTLDLGGPAGGAIDAQCMGPVRLSSTGMAGIEAHWDFESHLAWKHFSQVKLDPVSHPTFNLLAEGIVENDGWVNHFVAARVGYSLQMNLLENSVTACCLDYFTRLMLEPEDASGGRLHWCQWFDGGSWYDDVCWSGVRKVGAVGDCHTDDQMGATFQVCRSDSGTGSAATSWSHLVASGQADEWFAYRSSQTTGMTEDQAEAADEAVCQAIGGDASDCEADSCDALRELETVLSDGTCLPEPCDASEAGEEGCDSLTPLICDLVSDVNDLLNARADCLPDACSALDTDETGDCAPPTPNPDDLLCPPVADTCPDVPDACELADIDENGDCRADPPPCQPWLADGCQPQPEDAVELVEDAAADVLAIFDDADETPPPSSADSVCPSTDLLGREDAAMILCTPPLGTPGIVGTNSGLPGEPTQEIPSEVVTTEPLTDMGTSPSFGEATVEPESLTP